MAVDESKMELREVVGKLVKRLEVKRNFAGEPVLLSIHFNDRVLQVQHDPKGGEEQGELDIFPYSQ